VLPPITAQPADAPRVLSYAQQRLWFLARLEGAAATYNMPLALALHGALDTDALRRALCALVARQQSLRLAFPEADGVPTVIEHAPYDPLVVTDLSHLTGDAQQQAVTAHVREHALTPFDLAAGPLLRAALLVLDSERHVLLVNQHHIVSDGWSMGVMIRELAALYGAFGAGTEPALTPLAVHYTDYAAWQRAWLVGETLERQLGYWTEQLAGAPQVLALPADRPRPAVQSYRGAHLATQLDAALTARLKALGQARGATLFMTLLAAFELLLARYTGQDDLLVGSPIANRTAAGSEGLIGFFVNTLVLRARLDQAQTFDDLLAQVRRTALDAYAHQDLPFEQLVERLNPERSLSRSPLFQVMFVLQHNAGGGLDLPGLDIQPLAQDTPIAKFDLTLNAAEDGDGLRLVWEYATDLFEHTRIARMAEHFAVLLQGIVADPAAELRRLPLLTDRRDPPARRLERHRHRLPGRADRRRSVRGAGGGHARQHRAGVRGPDAHLRRPRRPRQPTGPCADRARRRPGRAGGAVRRALHRAGGRAARHPQGRRGLCAARSGLSRRAARVHAGGLRGAGGADAGAFARAPAGGAGRRLRPAEPR
jgi:hypothetical protein